MNCFTQHNGWDPESDYVLEDREGVRRAVCGDCAADAVRSRRWVHVTPIEAVGQSVMEELRAQGRESALDGWRQEHARDPR